MLKYTIKRHISTLEEEEGKKSSQIKDDLTELLKISLSHLNRLISIDIQSSSSLSTDQLVLLATYFQCPVDELINYPTKSPSNGRAKRTIHGEG